MRGFASFNGPKITLGYMLAWVGGLTLKKMNGFNRWYHASQILFLIILYLTIPIFPIFVHFNMTISSNVEVLQHASKIAFFNFVRLKTLSSQKFRPFDDRNTYRSHKIMWNECVPIKNAVTCTYLPMRSQTTWIPIDLIKINQAIQFSSLQLPLLLLIRQ